LSELNEGSLNSVNGSPRARRIRDSARGLSADIPSRRTPVSEKSSASEESPFQERTQKGHQ